MKTKLYYLSHFFFLIFIVHDVKAQAPSWEWAISLGNTGFDQGNSITIDTYGNIYTTGSFQATVDFDAGAGISILTAGYYSLFISKSDSMGNLLWAKSIGDSGNSVIGRSVVLDAMGNIYLAGNFYQTADFDPGLGTFNLSSAVPLK